MISARNWVYNKLRRSEGFFKTDMVYLAKGGFWLNTTTIASFISSFLLLYIYANYLSSVEYGTYRYLLSAYALLTVFTLGGVSTALTRSVAKQYDGDFIKAFKIQFLSSLVASVITLGIGLYYFLNSNYTLAIGFVILAFALPLMESTDVYQGMLSGKKLFREIAFSSVISSIISTIAIALAVIFNGNILFILGIYFISWIVIKIIFFQKFKRLATNTNKSEDFLKLGINFSLINLASGVSTYVDRIFLFQMIGAQEVAIYSFAAAPAEQIKGFFKNLSSMILPKLSTRSESEIIKGLPHKLLVMASVITPILVLYIFIIPYLFSIFFPQYMESVKFSQIYVLSLIGMLVIPINAAMGAIPKTKAMLAANVVSPILTLPITFFLILFFGLWGAVWAKVAVRVINLVVNTVALILPWGKDPTFQ